MATNGNHYLSITGLYHINVISAMYQTMLCYQQFSEVWDMTAVLER